MCGNVLFTTVCRGQQVQHAKLHSFGASQMLSLLSHYLHPCMAIHLTPFQSSPSKWPTASMTWVWDLKRRPSNMKNYGAQSQPHFFYMLRTKRVCSYLHSSLPLNNYPDFDMYSRAKEFTAASFLSKESGRSRGPGIDSEEVSDVICEIASRISSNAIWADLRRFASATSIPRETLITDPNHCSHC